MWLCKKRQLPIHAVATFSMQFNRPETVTRRDHWITCLISGFASGSVTVLGTAGAGWKFGSLYRRTDVKSPWAMYSKTMHGVCPSTNRQLLEVDHVLISQTRSAEHFRFQ
jgi:hypothetical protein